MPGPEMLLNERHEVARSVWARRVEQLASLSEM
jgi:hypothetical protein